jgi:hypothetical protein
MRTELRMRHLSDLPNFEGYRFVGIGHDGKEHACIVTKDKIGCHTIKRIADLEPYYFKLTGWRPADE